MSTAWGSNAGRQMPGCQMPGRQMPGRQLPGRQKSGHQRSGHKKVRGHNLTHDVYKRRCKQYLAVADANSISLLPLSMHHVYGVLAKKEKAVHVKGQ